MTYCLLINICSTCLLRYVAISEAHGLEFGISFARYMQNQIIFVLCFNYDFSFNIYNMQKVLKFIHLSVVLSLRGSVYTFHFCVTNVA